MADDPGGLSLEFQPIGRSGKVRLTARLPNGDSFTDKVDVADADGRARFLRGLCKGRRGIDRNTVAAELERIAGEIVARPKGDDGDDGDDGDGADQGRSSQADFLVDLVVNTNVELFHTPGGNDSEGYATVPVNDHRETWPINSKGFRRWLGRRYWERFSKAPNAEAMQSALNVISGIAIYEGPEHEVAVRVAQKGGSLYLDLADENWRAVQITLDGWQIVADLPVKFIRRRGMLALPVPVPGGNLADLRPLVNLPDDGAWMLFIAWLVAAFRPNRPFPILCVNGEQGSAKSTLCKMGRALIDPNQAPLRRPPRQDRDLMIAASNGWVMAFDNLSDIKPALSDAVCMLATGGGLSTRELYTDADEKIFDAVRPVMLNGIEDLATRPDLLDRAINLTLPEIPKEKRRDEDELWSRFEEARPRILGALLDAVSAALRNRSSVRLASKPRMADFACWVVAAEPALPWPSGAFLNAYSKNRGAANALALEASIIAPAIFSLLGSSGQWHGTARELLAVLEAKHTDEKTRHRKEWPATPRKLSGELRRLAPNLRRASINVTFGTHTKTGTPITLEQIGKTPSPPSPPSPDSPGESFRGDGDDGGDGVFPPLSDEPGTDEEVVEWTA